MHDSLEKIFQYPESTKYMLTFRKDSVNSPIGQKTTQKLEQLYKIRSHLYPLMKDIYFELSTLFADIFLNIHSKF